MRKCRNIQPSQWASISLAPHDEEALILDIAYCQLIVCCLLDVVFQERPGGLPLPTSFRVAKSLFLDDRYNGVLHRGIDCQS